MPAGVRQEWTGWPARLIGRAGTASKIHEQK
jgi:hypothetical protein